MLLTITATSGSAATGSGWPATDLGFLLHKNPGRVQSFEVSVGSAHVFYPVASQASCTAALLLEVDPVALVRGRQGPRSEGFSLGQYVNDRPYAASSMLAVALARGQRARRAAVRATWLAGAGRIHRARRDVSGLGRLALRRPAVVGRAQAGRRAQSPLRA